MTEPKKCICAECGRGHDTMQAPCACGSYQVVLRSVAVSMFGEDIVAELESSVDAVRIETEEP